MAKRYLICVLALLALAGGRECFAYGNTEPEFRALWVDAWHAGFKSTYEVDQLVAAARANHCNALFVQMRRRGDVYFPSSYEPFAPDANQSFDALAYVIQKAHSGSPRLEVHCAFATLAVATSDPSDDNHVCNKYPEYLTKDQNGSTWTGTDYWVDPGHPEALQYTYNVIMDVVNRYNVDGIHLDLIRYASNNYGYNDVSVARFNAINNRSGLPSTTDSAWSQWRRDQVTALVRKVYANSIAVKPAIKVSAATFTGDPAIATTDGWTNSQAYKTRLQDWRAWMEEGILDLNTPMDYYDCGESQYDTWICFILNHQYNRAAAITYSATGKECWCIQEQIGKIRNPSCGVPRSHGFSQFSYASGGTSCPGQLCPTHVPIPDMPWKSAPTTGHIKGAVNYGGLWMDHALVSITGPVSKSMYADGTGFYAFIDIPPGAYTVSATKSGYGMRTESVTVSIGQVSTRDLDLNRSGITFSNVQSTGETSTTATVTWSTNIPATSQVYYGTDRSCPNSTTEDATKVTGHSVTIAGLHPQTPYYFRVVSRTDTVPLAMSQVYALVTLPDIPDIIVDNTQAVFSGAWGTVTTGSGFYGANYRWIATGEPAKTATYVPSIPEAGAYKVYVYYPAGSNRTTAAPHTINYNGGSQTYTVNQTTNGSTWNLLATRQFAEGTSGSVVISSVTGDNPPKYVNADAVRFQLQPETVVPSTPSGLQAQAASHTGIHLTWNPSTDNVGVAGYRIYRDGAVVGISLTNSFTDTDLTPNKRYAYSVSAFDTSGNKSGVSGSVYRYTLSRPPTSDIITCDRQPGVWQTANPFVFNASGSFGVGNVSFYTYAWDTSPTHVWNGGEWSWAASSISLDAVSGPAAYYLHLRGYNDEYVPNGSLDLGPYYLDTTAPAAPVVTAESFSASSTSLAASWAVDEPESGIAVYNYAVGTSPGAADVLAWTATSDTGGTIAMPEQQAGTVLYVSVKAKNGAGVWGPVGSSGAVAVGAPATASEAKAFADASALRISGAVVTAVYGGYFYAADASGLAGIRVDFSGPYGIGDRVNVGGKLATVDGERRLVNAVVSAAE